MRDEDEGREVTFEIDTDDPCNVILTIKCEEEMDGADLLLALDELVRIIKSDLKREASGH